MPPSTSLPKRKSLWIPGIFIAAFGVLFIAEFFMVRQALNSWNGLVTEKSFVTGKNHNTTLQVNKRLKEIGWSGHFSATPLTHNKQSDFIFHLKNKQGNPVEKAAVTLRFHRPTHEGHDFSLNMVHQGQGIYRGQAILPLTGLWDIKISAHNLSHSVETMSETSASDTQAPPLSYYQRTRKYFHKTL